MKQGIAMETTTNDIQKTRGKAAHKTIHRSIWKHISNNIAPILLLLCLSIPQALCYMTNIGPWTIPDPDMHVPATYALATGQVFPEMTAWSEDDFGNTVHHPIISGDARYLTNDGTRNDLVSHIIQNPFQDPSVPEQQNAANSTEHFIRNANRATQYAPIGYIPQALGLRIGISLQANPYQAMQLARACNFVACLALYIAAIVLIPRMKVLMALIASIPTVCFISSSIMADGLTIALPALLTALAIHVIDANARMTATVFVVVTVISAMICYIKVLYLVPLLLILVLPEHIFSLKRKLCMSGILLLIFITYALWRHQFSATAYTTNYQNNMSYIIHHPLNTISVILINFVTGWWNLIPMNATIMVFGILLITISISPFLINRKVVEPRTFVTFIAEHRYLIVTLLGAMLAWALTYAFMALTWNDLTTVGAHGFLAGVQGRHALPLFPLLAVTGIYLSDHHSAEEKTAGIETSESPTES